MFLSFFLFPLDCFSASSCPLFSLVSFPFQFVSLYVVSLRFVSVYPTFLFSKRGRKAFALATVGLQCWPKSKFSRNQSHFDSGQQNLFRINLFSHRSSVLQIPLIWNSSMSLHMCIFSFALSFPCGCCSSLNYRIQSKSFGFTNCQ